ncbi:MAG: hypothetical protein CSA26_12580 [Desulfobacterales bacterium]|nr:MAG: hypothetical protein CSA26_12580 [Desulfobacterales bacterium]
MKKNATISTMFVMVVLSTLILSGCNMINTSTVSSKAGESVDALPAVPGFAGDIQDIVLPAELEWDRENSIGVKTESFRGGIYVYTGSVAVMSLKDYMIASMQDNKWKQVGETSSKDIMLAFVKANKTCMMVISGGGTFAKTRLTFYVTIDKTARTSMSPFGEAITQ